MKETLAKLCGRMIVVDTSANYIYIGILQSVGVDSAELMDVDVLCTEDTRSSREKYIMETKKHGVRANRKRAHINLRLITSISLLDDIIEY